MGFTQAAALITPPSVSPAATSSSTSIPTRRTRSTVTTIMIVGSQRDVYTVPDIRPRGIQVTSTFVNLQPRQLVLL